ncbi:MAG TPA: hypothetical protein VFW00_01350, partial [Rhodocyclaceae bacterium]|nr:hypothetical protein [Rhodocyclaceae bacterium]
MKFKNLSGAGQNLLCHALRFNAAIYPRPRSNWRYLPMKTFMVLAFSETCFCTVVQAASVTAPPNSGAPAGSPSLSNLDNLTACSLVPLSGYGVDPSGSTYTVVRYCDSSGTELQPFLKAGWLDVNNCTPTNSPYRSPQDLCNGYWPTLLRKDLTCPKGYVLSSGSCTRDNDIDPFKDSGSCPATGYPISLGSGNKFLAENDSYWRIALQRKYNTTTTVLDASALLANGASAKKNRFGIGWTFSYSARIQINFGVETLLWMERPNGRIYTFKKNGTTWSSDPDIPDRIVELKDGAGIRTGWRYWAADTQQYETYDVAGLLQSIQLKEGIHQTLIYTDGTDGAASGRGGFVLDANGVATTVVLPANLLLRVTDDFGHSLQFGYDFVSHIVEVSDGTITLGYAYNTVGNLSTVTYPDGQHKTYLYGENIYTGGATLPYALTGIIDENSARYVSYWYDSTGKALNEELSGGADHAELAFTLNNNGNVASTTVTDALSTSRTYGFSSLLSMNRLTSVSQPGGSGCGAASSAVTYDANGNVASRTDFNNTKQCSTYDLTRNLETAHIEGLSGSASCPADASTYSIPTPPAGTSV